MANLVNGLDDLLSRKGIIDFTYTAKTMGLSFTKRLQLNVERLQVSFLNKDGLVISNDEIESIISIYPSETDGCLVVTYRSETVKEDDNELKEFQWTFKPSEDASKFQNIVNLMLTNGRRLAIFFNTLDRNSNKYLDKQDLAIVLASYGNEMKGVNCDFFMIHKRHLGDIGTGRINFAELFAIMSTSHPTCLISLKHFLLEWIRLCKLKENIDDSGNYQSSKSCRSSSSSKMASSLISVTSKEDTRVFDLLLEGEVILNIVDHIIFTSSDPSPSTAVNGNGGVGNNGNMCKGDANLTNFRLILIEMESSQNVNNSAIIEQPFRYDSPFFSNKVSLPFASINRIELEMNNNYNNKGYNVIIVSKNLRVIRLGFRGGETYATQFISLLQSYAFPVDIKRVFAFSRFANPLESFSGQVLNGLEVDDVGSSKMTTHDGNKLVSELEYASISTDHSKINVPVSVVDGWKIFDVKKEFIRQGVLSPSLSTDEITLYPPLQSHWRLWSDNYTLVPTYPSSFILPAILNATDIAEAAKFRSRHRLPALTWQSRKNGACLCRSSQPMAGIASKKSLPDKVLLNLIRMRGNGHDDQERINPSTLYIIDCRSQLAANANMIMGKGVENVKALVQTNLLFCGIGNIHVMRDSLAMLHKVLIPYGPNAGYSTAVTNTVNRSVSALLYKRQQQNSNGQSSIGDSLDTSSSLSSSSSSTTGSYIVANLNSNGSVNNSIAPPPNNMANTIPGDESSKKSVSPPRSSSRFGGLGSRSASLPVASTESGAASTRGGNMNNSSISGSTNNNSSSVNNNNNLNDARNDITPSSNSNNSGSASVASILEASFLDRVDSSRQQWSRVEETGWLDHLRVLLDSSILIAETMLIRESSVLVHCSDGWDRTAQVCCTAQMILDPYYRTLEGLCVLIEKDWCGFGHKFHDRIGHMRSHNNEECKEVSPVFLQWLDLVSQMIFQFPTSFEYNEDLLVFIADSCQACQFGTFLGNSERERKIVLNVTETTQSIWSFVLDPKHIVKFKNPIYNNTSSSSSSSTTALADGKQMTKDELWPSSSRVRLWERYFCRWDAMNHPRTCTGLQWKEIWG